MANTFTQCYVQIVFAVKNRKALIHSSWKDELEKYITALVQNNNHKLLAIAAMPDHIHIFIGYNINQTIPKLVDLIKTSSNHWIKRNQLSKYKFDWQKGYGAFSYSQSQIPRVCRYVTNQEKHHQKRSFRKEYFDLLEKFNIDHDPKYNFDFFDEF